MSYFDAGAIVLIFIIFVIAHYYLAVHPLDLLLRFFEEFAQLARARLSETGAVNALGLLVVALFGVLILIDEVMGSLLALAANLLDSRHAHEYVASATPLTLFIVIAALAALSTFLTALGETPPRP
jgi:hypothetical protein